MTIEELLERDGIITYKVIGKSMEPMLLSNKDLITIRKTTPNSLLQENDVVLFKKKDLLVLHRIVQVQPNGMFSILGDNCSQIDKNIKRKDILGILIGFVHNGKHYEVSDDTYSKYVTYLRQNQKSRVAKKYFYDKLSWLLHFLPNPIFFRLKKLMKQTLYFKTPFDI